MEMDEYKSMEAAKRAVAEYIRYYRFDRKHSSLGYLTPSQFTRSLQTTLVS
jgi:transposase InsO family protein